MSTKKIRLILHIIAYTMGGVVIGIAIYGLATTLK
jgi:hypothetical protein